MNLLRLLPSLLLVLQCTAATLKVAAFDADVSPERGDPLIWTAPTTEVRDKLHAKGVVLQDGQKRYVLCAVDWCGIGNRTHAEFRRKVADAAGTTPDLVAIQSIHQHTAPYVDGTAYDLMRKHGAPVYEFTDKAIGRVTHQLASAVREAVGRLQAFDRIGTGTAAVERVASARRLQGPDGRVLTRYSTGGKSADLAAAPEGAVDTVMRTIAFAHGPRTVARLFYYATHPQTWCCDGVASADAVGTAREQLEREQKSPQIYFTGCAGDVTVGKYNDGGLEAREQIRTRFLTGMQRAIASTEWETARDITWRTAPLRLPVGAAGGPPNLKAMADEQQRYRAALRAVFASRSEPLTVSMLGIGKVRILHLPGEPMLEFQRYAQSTGESLFVAVAGYGDVAPGYICTDRAYEEGGYEPSASNTTRGAEAALKQVIRELLTQSK
jgi:hypothetical protein